MKFGYVCTGAMLIALLSACATEPTYRVADIIQARALSNHGMDLFVAGDTTGAIKALNAVIAYGSINADDYARRAAVYGTQKNYDKALADANRAIELEPSWRRYLERAVIYQRTGSYAAAIDDLDSAANMQPNEAELLRRRAYLKIVAARFDGAIADYENLTRILPRSDTGAVGRGAALYLAGRWPEAVAQFGAMLEKRPDDGLAALWLAKARLRSQQFMSWDELEPHAGPEPEWLMARVLLTVDSNTEASQQVAKVDACERALFMGLWRVVHAKGDNAASDFQAAQQACPLDSIEASEARVELARLKVPAAP